MNKKAVSNIIYLLFLALGIFLVWYQLATMSPADTEEFTSTITHVKWELLAPIFILMFLGHLVRAIRWLLLLKAIGYTPSKTNAFAAVMSGYFANSFIPRLGEVVRCTTLSRTGKYQVDKILGTVIAERIFDFFCYIILLLLTVFLQLEFISSTIKEQFSSVSGQPGILRKAILFIAIGAIILLALKYVLNKFAHIHVVSRIKAVIRNVASGVKSIGKMKDRGQFIFYTILMWALYLGQIYVGFKSVPGLEHLGFQVAFSVLSLATLSMIITPGGLGSFPIFVMQVLILYGIHDAVGKAFGWLVWGANTAFSLVIGLTCFLYLTWLNYKRTRQTSN